MDTFTEWPGYAGQITKRARMDKGIISNMPEDFSWCVAKGLFGLDDTQDGTLTWNPKLPSSIHQASIPYWHLGKCWEFGCDESSYWIDPGSAHEEIRFIDKGETKKLELTGKRIQFSPLKISLFPQVETCGY